jgi:hypothetical protein
LLWLLWLFSGILLGAAVAAQLREATELEKTGLAIAASFCFPSLLLLGISFATPFGANAIILSSIIQLIAAAFIAAKTGAFKGIWQKKREFAAKLFSLNSGILEIAPFFILLCVLFSSRTLAQGEGGLYSGGSSWGDLPFHLTLITSLASGGNFPPEYPIFSGERLTYAFLPDFQSAALYSTGLSLRDSVLVPSLLVSFTLCALLYSLAKRVFPEKKRAPLFFLILFFFVGGLGFLNFTGFSSSEIRNFTNWQEKGFFYSNIVVDLLLPQRTTLFGVAIALSAILLLLCFEKTLKRDLLAGALTGCLPLIQPHGALAVGVVSGILFLRKRVSWVFFAATGLLALPQLLWLFPRFSAQVFLRFNPFWVMPAQGNLLSFWLNNLPVLFLAIPGIWLLWKSGKGKNSRNFGKWLDLAIPFLALFALANLVVFQPWEWDNIKLLAFAALFAQLLAALALAELWGKNIFGKVVALALLLFCTLSGLLTVYWESQTSWMLYSNEDVKFAEAVKENTPPEAVFLIAPVHNHPVTNLAGRKAVLGYEGWLWSHGINYWERQGELNAMFEGDQVLLRKYNVSFIAWGPEERRLFSLGKEFKLLATSGDYGIYSTEIGRGN